MTLPTTMSMLRRYQERFVSPASPSALAIVRIIVCGTLFTNAVWENAPSLSYMPIELRHRMGLLEVLYRLPIGFEKLVTSEFGLGLFQALTATLMLLATVGLKARVTLPLAALSYAVLGGLLRQYAWFYHTCLIPLYITVALSFLPCADALSVDAWLKQRRASRDGAPGSATAALVDPHARNPRYGWSIYLCWLLLAGPYLLAGLSKLREGFTPPWWTALNFERIVLGTNLRPMHFDFDGALLLVHAHAPHWLFELLGISAVVSEIGFVVVLFSRWARVLLPPVMVLLHLGILFLQNILFFDLIVLQLIFLDWDWLIARVRERRGLPVKLSEATSSPGVELRYGASCAILFVVLVGWWVSDAEYYPFTSMQMFTGSVRTDGNVAYDVVLAREQSGRVEEFRIEEAIPALADTRYRHLLKARRKRIGIFLNAVAHAWNPTVEPGSRIVEFEIQSRVWNFKANPDDREHGRVTNSFRHTVE